MGGPTAGARGGRSVRTLNTRCLRLFIHPGAVRARGQVVECSLDELPAAQRAQHSRGAGAKNRLDQRLQAPHVGEERVNLLLERVDAMPSRRQVHRAGEKCFVDYAGQKPRLLDPATGALVPVELFVAVLGASNYTYTEATPTQQVPDWIGATSGPSSSSGASPRSSCPISSRAPSWSRAGTSPACSAPTRSSPSTTAR